MISYNSKTHSITISFRDTTVNSLLLFVKKKFSVLLFLLLVIISIANFLYYLNNGLGLAYNDARSHLDIGRRVVENLKPGFAQLGSVWLPLPHILMLVTVWNNFMWHTGFAGALQSMIAFVATGMLIYLFLQKINVGWSGRLAGIMIFITNLNILYLQSTAMTELLLLGTMMAGTYELILWHMDDNVYRLVKSAFWIFLSTLIRYDGWFLFFLATVLIFIHIIRKQGYKSAEGVVILFCTLGGFGIFLWLLWNQLIFKDVFYFISGPYAAATQQNFLAKAGQLVTKHNIIMSLLTYTYAVIYNTSLFTLLFAIFGAYLFFVDKRVPLHLKLAVSSLLAPFFFNILALFFGQSVIFVPILNGSWFNVRYGLMMIPSIAIFIGFFVDRVRPLRLVFLGLMLFIIFFSFANRDAVTIDDALIGASGKNVKEVSGWLKNNAANKDGFVLISVASHDAIIFSSGMDMSRFIHEGTQDYWDWATHHPSQWARWIIMRTHDRSDNTYRLLEGNKEFENDYKLVGKYPFADIYELKPQFLSQLHTKPVDYANKTSR